MKIIGRMMFILLVFVFNLYAASQEQTKLPARVVYKSETLTITQISENAFEHTSLLQTDDFGKVPCNGMIVRSKGEAVVFDTPSQDKDSEELIRSVAEKLNCKIIAIIPTHFHNDCLGGLKAFHDHGIASYASGRTITFARQNNFVIPRHSFEDSLKLQVGTKIVVAKFFGEGHTRDNVVGYFPAENILFGGCLIKEMNATKGFLGDANIGAWPATVAKVKAAYPDVKIIIPGHGKHGGPQLLDYTIGLFIAR
jgi:metallo-beta-lactamase class B